MTKENFREEMLKDLEDVFTTLVKWKTYHMGDMLASEVDCLYEAMVTVSDLEDAVSEAMNGPAYCADQTKEEEEEES